MTATWSVTAVRAEASRVRVLRPGQENRVQPLFARDPVRHCYAASRVLAGGLRPESLGGSMWEYGDSGGESAMLAGANLVPIETTPAARRAFAAYAIEQGRRSSSIVGSAREVLDLWGHLAESWGPPREIRPDQPLMVVTDESEVRPDRRVRPVRLAELETIFPACVAMFTEEVGVSPLAGGAGPGYRGRVAELIRSGRSFARFDSGRPIFKAELGAVSENACQIQGVWVDPDYRGRGYASAGMAAVVEFARQRVADVSLYVNSFNERAIAAYRRVGFRQIDTFATVLF